MDWHDWAEYIKEDFEKGDIEKARQHRSQTRSWCPYGSNDFFYWADKRRSKSWKNWVKLAEQIFEEYPCGTFTAKDLNCNGNRLSSARFWIGARLLQTEPYNIYEANLPLMYIVFEFSPLSEKIEKYYLDKLEKKGLVIQPY